jgi:hypothetical protein
MDLLTKIQDKIAYKVHQATYDPEAEKYAASKRAAQEAEDAARKKKQEEEEAREKAINDAKREEEEKRKKAEDIKARSEFNMGRFIAKIISTIMSVFFAFAVVAGGIYGAHLATNLNLYRSWPYRLLYAIYGFIFFPIVIGYVLGYRWWWKGKKPQYYAVLPLIPYFINQPVLATLLSWLSYKPDDEIKAFQEWKDVEN